jgi:hypothetical protein
MSNRIERIQQSKHFELTKNRHRKSGKIHYRINLIGEDWSWRDPSSIASWRNAVRDIVDPLRNKSGEYGLHWKFRSQKEAEMLYMTLVLKFS